MTQATIASKLSPRKVAVCPICGSSLHIQELDAWTETGDGIELPESITLECDSAPAMDSDEWDEWFEWHYSMPYVDWLPVDEKVLRWLNQPEQKELRDHFNSGS